MKTLRQRKIETARAILREFESYYQPLRSAVIRDRIARQIVQQLEKEEEQCRNRPKPPSR